MQIKHHTLSLQLFFPRKKGDFHREDVDSVRYGDVGYHSMEEGKEKKRGQENRIVRKA